MNEVPSQPSVKQVAKSSKPCPANPTGGLYTLNLFTHLSPEPSGFSQATYETPQLLPLPIPVD
jgi:hypothetical protein